MLITINPILLCLLGGGNLYKAGAVHVSPPRQYRTSLPPGSYPISSNNPPEVIFRSVDLFRDTGKTTDSTKQQNISV